MVENLKDAVASGMESTANAMAQTNPFLGLTLAAVLLFAGWSAYVNHQYQKELLQIKLKDQEIASHRVTQVDAFTELLNKLREDGANDRVHFQKQIESAASAEDLRYEKSADLINTLNMAITKLDEKMDMVINNQQIRSVIGRTQGANP